MKKKVLIIACIVLLVAVGVGVWYSVSKDDAEGEGAAAEAAAPYEVPPIQDEYKNDEFRFSLGLPEGFAAQEFKEEGSAGKSVVLQDAKGNGIQILITPYPDDTKIITADDVRADIPDMKVTDDQVVEIGNDYRGVAFMSDNEAFDGASREVWFVFRGNLYQISTYARLDSLLQSMFATWKFF